ncbi:type II toxin-antitoxin system HicB family antitoxin [Bradyrhizobium symbiodeficiens]|uniref:type II toxin-antitoxin system HicB family antitoxin n=1 Tax=Bradyrhizobium symbiodeficiens TaxID=1404367 RepID=UPI0030D55878
MDGTLLIQILHIDDLITTVCESAPEAQAAFEGLVDDYIQTCAEMNKEPSKPFKGSFNVRVTPSLHRKLAMQAAEIGETLNSYVASALEEKAERVASHKRMFAGAYYSKFLESYSSEEWVRGGPVRSERVGPVVRTSARAIFHGTSNEFYQVRN